MKLLDWPQHFPSLHRFLDAQWQLTPCVTEIRTQPSYSVLLTLVSVWICLKNSKFATFVCFLFFLFFVVVFLNKFSTEILNVMSKASLKLAMHYRGIFF